MPCDSSHLKPRQEERESVALLGFLIETGQRPTGKYDRIYGNTANLDRDTDSLCNWCKTHPDEIKNKSLEFQIWWRDHQIADAKKAREKAAAEARERVKQEALSKLSPEERKALGLK